MAALLYFAYGSNMCSARLRARVPSAEAIGPARLDGWRLRFNKHGRDGSAKANIVPCPAGQVWGVLYRFPAEARGALDAAEDLGVGYEDRWLVVKTAAGPALRALTYVGIKLSGDLPVMGWYRDYCLAGAREHDLPAAYLAEILIEAGRP
jgi:cation transport regulator ChaC